MVHQCGGKSNSLMIGPYVINYRSASYLLLYMLWWVSMFANDDRLAIYVVTMMAEPVIITDHQTV
jgi:hypothetical protein